MKIEVVTIGLGYIGLPTSALIASHGTLVLGVDINAEVVETINRGEIHIVEPELGEVVSQAVLLGFLRADTKPQEASVYLIVVPTPFDDKNEPDISYVEAATRSVIPLLKPGDLYIIESTSPVGTTEKMQKLIEKSRPELTGEVYMAYCPERVLPGNVMHELVENDRVIGGVDAASTQKAMDFYRKYVTGALHGTSARTAEMCKLVENSSRDAQIAFANELSLICAKAEIDVWELISLANKHPRVNILSPGCGVGGHCIAVDPYFLTSSFPKETRVISTAREVNNYKADWVVEQIMEAVRHFYELNRKSPVIALMGLAFKPNIDDLRESPAMAIASKVVEQCGLDSCYVVEPNILSHGEFDLVDYATASEQADIIAFLVGHNEFRNIRPRENKIVLDFCGIQET